MTEYVTADVTIAIITNSRTQQLTACLKSVKKQRVLPRSVLVIDNSLHGSAATVCRKAIFEKIAIGYIHKPGWNVPMCRNEALRQTKTKLLGFTDDDCVLDSRWVVEAVNSLRKQRQTFVLGKSLLQNKRNLIAVAQHTRDEYWREKNSAAGLPDAFDTKNVVFKLGRIKKNHISFDESCQYGWYDSADFDFGLQLSAHQLIGSYNVQMKIAHTETESLRRFLARAFARGWIGGYLNKKWKLGHRLVQVSNKHFLLWGLRALKNFPSTYLRYTKMIEYNPVHKLVVTALITLFENRYVRGYVSYTPKKIPSTRKTYR